MGKTHHPLIPREQPGLISVIIPIYNEAEVLPLLFERLHVAIDLLDSPVEVLLVNDGSSDESIELLMDQASRDHRFKVVGLARNFGHQIAATAGLDRAMGDVSILLDADLQDPPELMAKMVEEYRKGYDVVYARRVGRQGESLFKRATAWMFYRLMRTLVHADLPADVGDFRLMSRQCLDALRSMRELHRFLRGMVTWIGFPQTNIDFVRPARAAGETKYPLKKMLLFAWNAALSFSPLPLRLSFGIGFSLMSIGMLYSFYALWQYMSGGFVVPGWTSLIVLNCLTAGAVMIAIGILGEYVGRIFEEIKERPLYVVSITSNLDADTDRRQYHSVHERITLAQRS